MNKATVSCGRSAKQRRSTLNKLSHTLQHTH